MKCSILSIATGIAAAAVLTQCGKFPSIYDPIEPPPWEKADPDSYDDPTKADEIEATADTDQPLVLPPEETGTSPDLMPIGSGVETTGNRSASGLQSDSESTSSWSRVNLANYKFFSDSGNKLPENNTSIELTVDDISKNAKSTVYTAFPAKDFAGKKVRLTGEVSGLETKPGSICEVMLRSWSGARSLAARTTESFATVRNSAQEMKTIPLSKTAEILTYNNVDLELDVHLEAEWIAVVVHTDNGSIKARGLGIKYGSNEAAAAPTPTTDTDPLSEILEPETPGTPIEAELPYGQPTEQRGVVISPHAGKKVRVGDQPRGQRVECPYTGKIFLVP